MQWYQIVFQSRGKLPGSARIASSSIELPNGPVFDSQSGYGVEVAVVTDDRASTQRDRNRRDLQVELLDGPALSAQFRVEAAVNLGCLGR